MRVKGIAQIVNFLIALIYAFFEPQPKFCRVDQFILRVHKAGSISGGYVYHHETNRRTRPKTIQRGADWGQHSNQMPPGLRRANGDTQRRRSAALAAMRSRGRISGSSRRDVWGRNTVGAVAFQRAIAAREGAPPSAHSHAAKEMLESPSEDATSIRVNVNGDLLGGCGSFAQHLFVPGG
jgi:hypothetical protein